MWHGQPDESGQWRVISQFMRLFSNLSGGGVKAIAPANTEEPIKLRVRVRYQDNRKFIYPAAYQETVGDLKRHLSDLTGQKVTTVFDGEYELFDSLKIGHVLRSEDEIEVEIAGKNGPKHSSAKQTPEALQGGLTKRPPDTTQKQETIKPNDKKANDEKGSVKRERKNSIENMPKIDTPFKADKPIEKKPVLPTEQPLPAKLEEAHVAPTAEITLPKKKKSKPANNPEVSKPSEFKPSKEPMNQEPIETKQVNAIADDEPISLATDTMAAVTPAKMMAETRAEETVAKEKEEKEKKKREKKEKKDKKAAVSQDMSLLDGFLDGLGKEKIDTLNKKNGKEPMSKRQKQKQGDGDELVFSIPDKLDTDSEGRSPAKFASPKEVKETEKQPKKSKKAKAKEKEKMAEEKPQSEATKPKEPSEEEKKAIAVQQSAINKRINLAEDSESSDSELNKVKPVKPKSQMTGKLSTETVFKSVISGGSEMDRIIKQQKVVNHKDESESSSDEELSPIKPKQPVKARKVSQDKQASEHVDKDEVKKIPVNKANPVNSKMQNGNSDSSESSDSEVPTKKPIKVFKKQVPAAKPKVESESESESEEEGKKKATPIHKYDQKNNIFKNNKLNQAS